MEFKIIIFILVLALSVVGCKYLNLKHILEYDPIGVKYEIDLYADLVVVIGIYGPKKVVIKSYYVDYTDPDSYDYAMLCAEELKEKLEEKI